MVESCQHNIGRGKSVPGKNLPGAYLVPYRISFLPLIRRIPIFGMEFEIKRLILTGNALRMIVLSNLCNLEWPMKIEKAHKSPGLLI